VYIAEKPSWNRDNPQYEGTLMEHLTDDAVKAAPLVGVGDRAPDVTVAGADGQPVRLADLWQRGPTVLVFTRQLG
jgi:hypothetical protein